MYLPPLCPERDSQANARHFNIGARERQEVYLVREFVCPIVLQKNPDACCLPRRFRAQVAGVWIFIRECQHLRKRRPDHAEVPESFPSSETSTQDEIEIWEKQHLVRLALD